MGQATRMARAAVAARCPVCRVPLAGLSMSDPSRPPQNSIESIAESWRRFLRTRTREWGRRTKRDAIADRVPSLAGAMSPDRNFEHVDWRLLSEGRWQQLAELGFRLPIALRSPAEGGDAAATAWLEDVAPPSRPPPDFTAIGVASICTRGYLPYARTLFESVRRVHPEARLYLCLADEAEASALDLPGVHIIPATALGLPNLPFLRLKYSATELCCALKPYLLRHLMTEGGPGRYVYIDSDICVYARLNALIDGLDEADFVVTPHMTAPFPGSWDGRVKPTQGDLLYAGLLNAGVFAMRAGDAAVAFLDTWATLVTQPGAFMPAFGGQHEQHAFNWILAFVERVRILRDPAINVGYWNLHDRSLRWLGLDDGAGWTVNGQPLVCFHFSGFAPEQPFRLSRHEGRYLVHLMPSVERLLTDYRARLHQHGWRNGHANGYPHARFPSGLPIDDMMRDAFKEIELSLDTAIDPWASAGEEYYAQAVLSSHPDTGSLIPVLLQRLYRDRVDLQRAYPDCELEPQPILEWFQHHGLSELPPHYRQLYDRYRPVVPDADVVQQLRTALDEAVPFRDVPAPFTAGRAQILARMTDSRHRQLRQDLATYKGERYFTSAVRLLWQIYEKRPDLKHLFPDVLGDDADRFAEWLAVFGPDELTVTPRVHAAFVRCAGGRSLARIFSFVNRTHWMMERWPLAFVGRDRDGFARALLGLVREDLEFDAEDIVAYLWTMHLDPYAGLPLALELVHNLSATPSSRLVEGQEALLAEPLRTDPRCREALTAYRLMYGGADDDDACHAIRTASRVAIDVSEHLTTIAHSVRTNGFPTHASDAPSAPQGANLFGYFRSPIGLGEMSRGTSAAMRAAGLTVAESIIGNVAMDADLRPADFIRRFDHRLPVNIFVSYPHLNSVLLHGYPQWMTAGRTNIVHLAWEQRDSAPHWRDVFANFDQVWALSGFAARSLERQLGRPVQAVNCVLDTTTLPPSSSKGDFGLRDRAFTFLYALDANSSLERKNPEAVVEAFTRAFPGREDVELCLKISNTHRLEHRARLQRILSGCQRDRRRIRVLAAPMGRRTILQLIAAVDCYVSLHRAEGFGYTCAEAMAYGRPVIATKYSGNLDFMTDENSWLVNAREIEVQVAEGPFQRGSIWADADVDHAAACMREVYERQQDARRRAARGREDVIRLLSPQAVGASIRRALASVH